MNTATLRWLVKPDGSKALQQLVQEWTRPTPYNDGYGGDSYPTGRNIWVDVPEVTAPLLTMERK